MVGDREPGSGSRSHVLSSVRNRIINGLIPAGGRVPDRRTLATEFAVSTFTVQRALEALESDGFIESVRRRGTFVRPRPPHLCHYGLVFAESPDSGRPWSRFWAGLSNEARTINERGERQISIFYGIDGHRDAEGYRQLVSEVRRQRFAGLTFTSTPSRGLVGTPILSQQNMPRVAMHEEKWMPGIKGVSPDPWSVLVRAFDEAAARGRKRIALLTTNRGPHDFLHVATSLAEARGLDLRRTWVQQVDEHATPWAAQLVELIFDQANGAIPDTLIIDDDNLVEPATTGLVRTRAGAAGEVFVINHCNFPHPPHSLVPNLAIGFDLRGWLESCFDLIDQIRRGDPNPQPRGVPAVTEAELALNGVAATANTQMPVAAGG
jgi:DNA-binding LacI/PurR family transcriptional regulator